MRGIRTARAAFTLVELLVSVALAVFLTSLAWTMFSQAQRLVKRAQARVQLHASAKSLFESLRRDLGALQPSCAFWLRSTARAAGAPGTVDLVFMTAAVDDQGFRMAGNEVAGDFFIPTTTDLVWSRWSWDGQRLSAARNDLGRSFARKQFEAAPTHGGLTYNLLGYYKYGTAYNAQPRRMTPADDVTRLDDNRWDLPERPGLNRGDWTDLEQKLMPVTGTIRVTACAIEAVLAGGTQVRRADGTATLDFCARGVRLDGLTERTMSGGAGGRDEIAERPALLRIAFTLEDGTARISERFSFSFALPGPAKHL